MFSPCLFPRAISLAALSEFLPLGQSPPRAPKNRRVAESKMVGEAERQDLELDELHESLKPDKKRCHQAREKASAREVGCRQSVDVICVWVHTCNLSSCTTSRSRPGHQRCTGILVLLESGRRWRRNCNRNDFPHAESPSRQDNEGV
jgi:hypothetical protein